MFFTKNYADSLFDFVVQLDGGFGAPVGRRQETTGKVLLIWGEPIRCLVTHQALEQAGRNCGTHLRQEGRQAAVPVITERVLEHVDQRTKSIYNLIVWERIKLKKSVKE
jgi:hypothetical protein